MRDALSRAQFFLTITYSGTGLVIAYFTHLLQLGMFFSVILLILSIPIVYLLFGKALVKTRRAISSQKLFASNIAHELRGPMQIMQLNSEFGLEYADSKLSQKKFKQLITALGDDLDELKNMANIIKNLSIMSANEYGSGQLELGRVDLNPLLERLCQAVSKQYADVKEIKIKLNTKNKLPVYVFGNKSALEQAVMNLLKNAVAYTPKGGTIAASALNNQNKVILSIKDNGIGISKEDLPRIFTPFYRVRSDAAKKEKGSGLGLAIVAEIVKQHKAKIAITSIIRKGTEVSIIFPKIAKSI